MPAGKLNGYRADALNPTAEAGADGFAKSKDAQGFTPTKPLLKEIPARRRKEYQSRSTETRPPRLLQKSGLWSRLASQLRWPMTSFLFKQAGKVRGGGEPQFLGYFMNGLVGSQHRVFGTVNSRVQGILPERQTGPPFK
jgi:hypothetical protein